MMELKFDYAALDPTLEEAQARYARTQRGTMMWAMIDPRCGGPMAYWKGDKLPQHTDLVAVLVAGLCHADGSALDLATPFTEWGCESCGRNVLLGPLSLPERWENVAIVYQLTDFLDAMRSAVVGQEG